MPYDSPSPRSPVATSAAPLPADTSDERRQIATRVLGEALLLGVVGDAVLRANSPGVNVTIWVVAVVTALITLAKRRHDTLPTDVRWLLLPALAIAAMFAWRADEALTAYNVLVLIGTLGLLASAVRAEPDHTILATRVRDVVHRVFGVALGVAFGMPRLVITDVSLREVTTTRASARVITGLRASLIAIPLLMIFGGLFAAADPVFARIASDVLRIDAGKVASHLVLSGFLAWIVGGFLRTALLSSGRTHGPIPFPDGALGLTEVSVALGSLVLLFAAFVGVQFRYFFGGEAIVTRTAGMGYADYARRGFFELVTVSALVLPVLLSANALLRRDTPIAGRVYRALASTLLVLLAVIMYSALARMRLYQSIYGLSTDRLYATVFMAWLAAVFAWFAFTVLRGRERPFVGGVLVSGWGTLIALNLADPAGLVARANIARAQQGKELDVSYINSLGADAAPALAAYLVRQPLSAPAGWVVPGSDSSSPTGGAASEIAVTANSSPTRRDDFTARCRAARTLLSNWAPETSRDWRSWTVGAARARRAVATHEAPLRRLAGTERVRGTYVRCAEAPPT